MDLNKMCLVTQELINIKKIGFMYKEQPDNKNDSGWRFFTGNETQSYVDKSENIILVSIKDVIKKIDSSVEKYLDCEIETAYERIENTDSFTIVEDYTFGKE